MQFHNSTLQESNRNSATLADTQALMEKKGFPEDEIIRFTGEAERILDKCSEHFGAGTQFQYLVSKVHGRVKLRIIVQGDSYDPLSDKDAENNDVLDYVEQAFGEDKSSFTSYQRFPGRNSITVSSAKQAKKAPIFKSPMLWAIALGVICGLICQRLPDHISTFLIDGLADPIGDIALALIAGVTGPVIFLSLITSISSLGSINRLTDLGFKIMWRFIKCTLFIIAVSIGVSLLFYSVFGSGTIQFSPEQLVSMLLKLIPTNIIEPFLNNNTPQLVILAIALGAALLLMEDRTPGLTASLRTLHMWSTSFMKLVFLVVPVIPFVSVFKAFAAGRMQVLLDGWEFIVGVVVALTICCLVKLIKVSLKCRLRIPVLLKKTMPIASLAFSSGSESATLNLQIEHSRNELGINPSFSDFWIPMSHAMFKPRTTIHLVIPPFLIAKAMGLPISQTFLFVLIIMVLELSMASSGITGAWTILFAALGLPMEYVGLYVIYKVFTTNIACGGCEFYYTLEQIEASAVLDTIDRTCYGEDQ